MLENRNICVFAHLHTDIHIAQECFVYVCQGKAQLQSTMPYQFRLLI
jgi:hypothetical protein